MTTTSYPHAAHVDFDGRWSQCLDCITDESITRLAISAERSPKEAAMKKTLTTDESAERGYGPDDADRDALKAIEEDHESGHHDAERHGGCPVCDAEAALVDAVDAADHGAGCDGPLNCTCGASEVVAMLTSAAGPGGFVPPITVEIVEAIKALVAAHGAVVRLDLRPPTSFSAAGGSISVALPDDSSMSSVSVSGPEYRYGREVLTAPSVNWSAHGSSTIAHTLAYVEAIRLGVAVANALPAQAKASVR